MSSTAFPQLPQAILDTMALRPAAPMTERLLFDALEGSPGLRGLTMPDVEAATMHLVNIGQLVRTVNHINGVEQLKLTTAAKVNQGVA